jgi:prophage antirepressor-like protein
MDEHNKPWFVAKDMAELLGYVKTENAIKTHCKSVKTCPLESGG